MEVQKVYAAISAVQSDLATTGIAKTRKNQQQGFMFRGIDEIYGALAPLLAKHKLCILPRLISREAQARETRSGSALYSVVVHAEFDFVSAEDGSKHTLATFGEAMDSADKATNKAMSAAYKYVCIQAFCIPLEGEDNDADATTPQETVVRQPVVAAQDQPDPKFKEALERAAAQGEEAYRKAWQSGTPAQRKSCAAIHETLKEHAKTFDSSKAEVRAA